MAVEHEEPAREGEAPSAFKRARAQSERSKARAVVRRPLTAWAGKALLRTASRVPLARLHALGRAAGRLGARLPLAETRVTRTNVDLCFPELPAAERARLVRASLGESACMLLELGHFWMRPVDEVCARVVEVRGEEHFTAALQRGRGVICAAPHLGAWELASVWIGARAKVTTMYRPPRVRELEELYTAARSRTGSRLVPADAAGVRAVFHALERGELSVLLPDQDPGRGAGVFVPFFGVPANTSTLLPRIAARSGASVILAFVERLPRDATYRIHIRPGAEEIGGADLERGARALNRDIEACVRLAPEQYLWSYKRFKSRPPGEPKRYREAD